ncbi:MAG: hypothetical protein IT292_01100 [Deltaproteobacteria bacterium]|nr:hypothetical protein [Deltaproteobacteria bacterium]
MAILGLIIGYSVLNPVGFKQIYLRQAAEDLLAAINALSLIGYHSHNEIKLTFVTGSQEIIVACSDSCPKANLFLPPFNGKNIVISQAKFGNFSSTPETLVLRADGSASPGKIILTAAKRSCTITQASTGYRHYECN